MIALTAHAQGTILAVRAQPGARKNAVLGEHAGAMRVAVSAAPERGKANAAIQDVLARALGVKASQVALISGEAAREKRFLVVGLAPDELRRRLDAALPGGG
ncbi:MAG: DUF167 domain-containing protein [Planctomycetaceae bacterium]|nr:DUF167 domain-containing protein [Planctomycetaceae bacterium]